MTKDGSAIADWGKYETVTFQSPSGPFKMHFYKNAKTGSVNYRMDSKAKCGAFDGMTAK